jgi:hypothetical protein
MAIRRWERWIAYRHFARAVRNDDLISGNNFAHALVGKHTAISLRDGREFGDRDVQCRSCGAIAFCNDAMTGSTISPIKIASLQGANERAAGRSRLLFIARRSQETRDYR